jgi:hypothetical protein
MAMRIVHHYYFITEYFAKTQHTPLKGAVPAPEVFAALVACWCGTSVSFAYLCTPDSSLTHKIAHVGIGAVLLVAFAVLLYLRERSFLLDLLRLRKGGKRD